MDQFVSKIHGVEHYGLPCPAITNPCYMNSATAGVPHSKQTVLYPVVWIKIEPL